MRRDQFVALADRACAWLIILLCFLLGIALVAVPAFLLLT